MLLKKRRCWACGNEAVQTTFVGTRRKEMHYCRNHEPRQVTTFRIMAFSALLRGNESRKAKVT